MIELNQYKNPFVGLRAFEEEEDYLFFGRSVEIKDLLKKFGNSRFMAVIGSSGSGKSSLVKSGLLPALYSGFLSVGHNWRVALLRPGNNPIGNLSNALSKPNVLFENPELNGIPCGPIIESTLRRSSNGLSQVYKQSHLAETDNLLIVIDQFEELFRFSQYEKQFNQAVSDSLNFINLLLSASKQTECPVYVLLTMRSDFLGDCAQFRGLPEAINEGQYLVPRMTRDEIKEAITGPIAIGGAQITQSLLTRLLNDVGNDIDQLPVLQHAMMRTWDAWVQRNQPSSQIQLDDYLKIGGMGSSLSQHANEIYNELRDDQQRTYCELMFKALTDKAADVRGTRRPRTVSDLSLLAQAPAAEIISIIEAFRKPGRTLLMPPIEVALEESTVIDISHESLMRVWDKLKTWTEEEVQSAEIFKRLVDASVRESTGLASLWTDPELAQGLNWKGRFNDNEELIKVWAKSFDVNTQLALTFLDRSKLKSIEIKAKETEEERLRKKEEDSRKKVRVRSIVIGILLLMTIGAIATTVQFQRISHNAILAKDSAEFARRQADTLRILASRQADTAKLARWEADSLKGIAILQKDTAVIEKKKADSLKIIAILQKDTAEIQKKKADELSKAYALLADSNANLARKSAAAQYQKLIREFPTDDDLIKNKNFEAIQKLLLYCCHLDTLRNTYKIQSAQLIDHELYDKLYFCLKAKGKKYALIQKNMNSSMSQGNKGGLESDYKVLIDPANKNKMMLYYKQKPFDSVLCKKEIQSYSYKTSVKTLLYAASDNCLYVCTYDNEGHRTTDKISMGGLVTYIHYYAEESIIYFGLKTGEIGYIRYKKDSRNQPIYRNNLGSKITSLEAFKDKFGINYLFATSYNGRAMVYELGSDKEINSSLKPDKKLNEIELPEYKGVIVGAAYNDLDERLLLETSKGTYFSWDPFTRDLRKILEEIVEKNPLPREQLNNIRKECTLY